MTNDKCLLCLRVCVCAFMRKRQECVGWCAFDFCTRYLCVFRVKWRERRERTACRRDESSLIRLLFIVSLAHFIFLGGCAK